MTLEQASKTASQGHNTQEAQLGHWAADRALEQLDLLEVTSALASAQPDGLWSQLHTAPGCVFCVPIYADRVPVHCL